MYVACKQEWKRWKQQILSSKTWQIAPKYLQHRSISCLEGCDVSFVNYISGLYFIVIVELTTIFIQERALDNIVCKMSAML